METELLKITEVRNSQNILLDGVVVIAILQSDFSQVVHTAEGVDFPVTTFLRANKTANGGKCDIAIPKNSGPTTVAFFGPNPITDCGIKVHV